MFKKIVKRIMQNRGKVDDVTHKKKNLPVKPIDFVRDIILKLNYAAQFVGVSVGLIRNWKWKLAAYITTFTIIYGLLLTVISSYYTYTEGVLKLIEWGCVVGVVFPASMKFALSVKCHTSNFAFCKCMTDIASSNPDGKRATIIIKYSIRAKKLISAVVIVQLTATMIYGIYPMYDFFINGHYTLFVPIYVPLVDWTTFHGYIINILQQLWFSAYTSLGSILFDCFLAFLLSNINTMIALIEDDFYYLDKMTENQSKSERQRSEFLKNILKQFYDINRYFHCINKKYNDIILVQMTANCFTTALSLFTIVANDNIGGVGIVLFSYTQMSLLCYLGTLITTANEHLSSIIYGSKWYLYSVHDQKLILTMLSLSQNGAELWIGSLAPLNVETGKKISNSIYSYFTMLLNFIK